MYHTKHKFRRLSSPVFRSNSASDHATCESGQTLVLVVVIMVLLLLAILFLFDLQNIIRGKIKVDVAEQSAAMTAAEWQKNGLNLIGEINLLKAALLLSEDEAQKSPNDDTPPALTIAGGTPALSELQVRTAFVIPLIAYGAAGQAAKNNGMDIRQSPEFSNSGNDTLVYKSYRRDLDEYISTVSNDNYRYPDTPIRNYAWKSGYLAMLSAIRASGSADAFRPGGNFTGLKNINPPWLALEGLYQAILKRDWCYTTLRTILKSDYPFEGTWWDIDFIRARFREQSEIYPLEVSYRNFTFTDPELVELDSFARAYGLTLEHVFLTSMALEPVSYDYSRWQTSPMMETGLKSWGDRYLHSPVASNLDYLGGVAYAECSQRMPTLNRYQASRNDSGFLEKRSYEDSVINIGSDSSEELTYSGALAKVLGKLPGNGRSPLAVEMVLPVFYDVTLAPTSMPNYQVPFRYSTTTLEQFLIFLAENGLYPDPGNDPPAQFISYINALRLLEDEAFRHSGWNPNWQQSAHQISEFFTTSYHYSPGNTNGAGWLQQIHIANSSFTGGVNIGGGIYKVERGNRTFYYKNDEFITYDSTKGRFLTNEDMLCSETNIQKPPTGPGTGVPKI